MIRNTRKKILFDQGWNFNKVDVVKGYCIDYDDSNWQNVNLPH
jgi:uncharacterized protein YbdZ (MbtH family)